MDFANIYRSENGVNFPMKLQPLNASVVLGILLKESECNELTHAHTQKNDHRKRNGTNFVVFGRRFMICHAQQQQQQPSHQIHTDISGCLFSGHGPAGE